VFSFLNKEILNFIKNALKLICTPNNKNFKKIYLSVTNLLKIH